MTFSVFFSAEHNEQMKMRHVLLVFVCLGEITEATLKQNGKIRQDGLTNNFSFASYYGDHMVLQQSPSRPMVWGYANLYDKGKIRVVVSSPNIDYSRIYEAIITKGPFLGKTIWSVQLDPREAGGPYSLNATLRNKTIALSDVMFGDVWLCSGQSNMEFTIPMMFKEAVQEEYEQVKNYQDLRLFTAAMVASNEPLYDLRSVRQNWTRPSKGALGGDAPHKTFDIFSAVCWLYGKYLYKTLKHPIGLVASDWGGTAVEVWSSPDSLKKCGVTRGTLPQEITKNGDIFGSPKNSSSLWNAMIHPLLNMTIKGAIWYQGEANAEKNSTNYNCTFPEMIKDWRTKFHTASKGETDAVFPFGFAQLNGNRPPVPGNITYGFPSLRWQQTANYGYVPNAVMPRVFMAVTMDLPDFTGPEGSDHSRYKPQIAERLAMAGLAVAYYKELDYQGPLPALYNIDTDKHNIAVIYDTIIDVRNNSGFEVCCPPEGDNTACDVLSLQYWLPAPILKHDNYSIVLEWDKCASQGKIYALRYSWRETPCNYLNCAIYGRHNKLPAPPLIMYGNNNGKWTRFNENKSVLT